MSMGFTAEPSAEEALGPDAAMMQAALTAEAVDVGRVLAYGTARHLLRDLRHDADDVAALAVWLNGGPAAADDEDDEPEEDEPEEDAEDPAPLAPSVAARDWWPSVMLALLCYLLGVAQ